MKIRTTWVVIGVLSAFFAVAIRLVDVQFVDRSKYRTASLREHQRFLRIQGERGVLLDRNDHVLAENRDVPSLVADPELLRSRLSPGIVSARLAPVLSLSPAHIKKMLMKKTHFIWVRHGLSNHQVRYFRTHRLPGLFIVEEEKRFYPEGVSSHAVLGSTGLENAGLSGLEKTYDNYLTGRKGGRILEISARGKSYFSLDQKPPQGLMGDSVFTTIDGRLQKYAQDTLDEQVASFGAEGGVVLVMDPRTGGILAMAANTSGKGLELNPAISMVYEPGSIFKLVTASAALNEHRVSLTDHFDGHNGVFYIPGGALHDDEPSKSLTLGEILVKSSNIGISQVGLRLGPDLFYRYIKGFGFGQRTGVDFPGESVGIVHSPARWSHRSIYSMSMGQEVGVTPIQIVTAVSAIANGGHLLKPYLVRKIVDYSGRTVYRRDPEKGRRVISPETSRTLLELLRNVVAPGGTGVNAVIQGYEVAGKTGTAQVYDPMKHAYTRRRTIDSFVGVLPVSNPSLVILAVVVKPKKLSWGGTVAAPLFRKVAEMALVRFRIPSDEQVRDPAHHLVAKVVAEGSGTTVAEKIK
ncbi:MAG: peptidoglycan D,D-transpeptidase FtsI family protein [Leptospirales bacterium]